MITIKHNLPRVIADISAKKTKLGMVVAKAVNGLAYDIRDQVRRAIPSRFTLRRNWIVQGIRVELATPARLRAKVKSIDPFMARQEYGGEKKGVGGRFRVSGRLSIAIPLPAAQPHKGVLVPKRDQPEGLQRAETFVARSPRGKVILYARFKRGKRKGLRAMYILKPSVRVRPRLGLVATGKAMAKRWPAKMSAVLAGWR